MPDDDRTEAYSVDEMMERLRAGERAKREEESKELVTRPDGTQVMRVRRRKRRTQQQGAKTGSSSRSRERPKASGKKQFFLLVAILVGLLIPLILTLAILYVRMNSDSFAQRIHASVEDQSGGTVTQCNALKVSLNQAEANAYQVEWPESSPVRKVALSEVHATLNWTSSFTSKWGGANYAIAAEQGTVLIGTEGPAPIPRLEQGEPLDEFSFPSYHVEKADIIFERVEKPSLAIYETYATFRPLLGSPHSELTLDGGRLLAPVINEIEISRATVNISESSIDLISLHLDGGEGASGKLSGKISTEPDEDRELKVELSDFPIELLIGKYLARIVDARITCVDGTLSIPENSPESIKLRLPFTASTASLGALPCLDWLRQNFGDVNYAQPVFTEKIHGVLEYTPGEMKISDLRLELLNFKVFGDLASNSDGELSGKLKIGLLTKDTKTTARGRQLLARAKMVSGLHWVDVILGGTVELPRDSLTSPELQPRSESLPGEVEQEADSESLFYELTQ